MTRIVFVPPRPGANVRLGLYEELCRLAPALYLAESRRDLVWGAVPGASTLIYGKNEPFFRAALEGASGVVSFRRNAARHAGRAGVPFLLADERTTSRDLAALVSRSGEGVPRERRAKGRPLRLACIVSYDYLPFYLGLESNLREVHEGRLEIHVLALDDKAHAFLASRPGAVVRKLADLWSPRELARLEGLSQAQRAYASKPRLLQKCIEETGRPFFFSDADIYYWRSPLRLVERLRGKSTVLLFPHWNDHAGYNRTNGVYNAGMLAVRPGAERFLTWWSKACLMYCGDTLQGFFNEQGYLDMGHSLFDGLTVYRDADENVAPWNLETLGVRRDSKRPWRALLSDGRPVGSFHASQPDSLGLYEVKYLHDQLTAFFSELEEPEASREFLSGLVRQQAAHFAQIDRWHHLSHAWKRYGLPFAAALEPTPARLRYFGVGLGGKWLTRAWPLYRLAKSIKLALSTPRPLKREAWREDWVDLVRWGLGAESTILPGKNRKTSIFSASKAKDSFPWAKQRAGRPRSTSSRSRRPNGKGVSRPASL